MLGFMQTEEHVLFIAEHKRKGIWPHLFKNDFFLHLGTVRPSVRDS